MEGKFTREVCIYVAINSSKQLQFKVRDDFEINWRLSGVRKRRKIFGKSINYTFLYSTTQTAQFPPCLHSFCCFAFDNKRIYFCVLFLRLFSASYKNKQWWNVPWSIAWPPFMPNRIIFPIYFFGGWSWSKESWKKENLKLWFVVKLSFFRILWASGSECKVKRWVERDFDYLLSHQTNSFSPFSLYIRVYVGYMLVEFS